MRPIEAELHQIMEDIMPNSTPDEQARIVAEAAAIFERKINATKFNKIAHKADQDMIKESMMADAILQAIKVMDDWSNDDYAPSFIDGRGLSNHDVLAQAREINTRFSYANNAWGEMDILNDDLDQFLEDEEDEYPNYDINDGHESHNSDVFFSPDRGRHRSDSLSRNS